MLYKCSPSPFPCLAGAFSSFGSWLKYHSLREAFLATLPAVDPPSVVCNKLPFSINTSHVCDYGLFCVFPYFLLVSLTGIKLFHKFSLFWSLLHTFSTVPGTEQSLKIHRPSEQGKVQMETIFLECSWSQHALT